MRQQKLAWWKRGKCQGCGYKFKKHDNKHELELNTADGITKMTKCENCAEFWDKSADILQGKTND